MRQLEGLSEGYLHAVVDEEFEVDSMMLIEVCQYQILYFQSWTNHVVAQHARKHFWESGQDRHCL